MILSLPLTPEGIELLGDYVETLPAERQNALVAALELVNDLIREFNGKVAQA